MVARVRENPPVITAERPYEEVKGDPSILQLFSDKYGETVRVVEIGDYSKELCGGTHVSRLSQVGFVKVIMEGGIAAGVRRIEAVAGDALTDHVLHELPKQDERWQQLNAKKQGMAPLREFKRQADPHDNWLQLLARQESLTLMDADIQKWEKEEAVRVEAFFRKRADEESTQLILNKAKERNMIPTIIEDIGDRDPDYLNYLFDAINRKWTGILVVGARHKGRALMAASVADAYRDVFNASQIVQEMAPIVKGKGGGKPAFARGAGEMPEKIPAALKHVIQLLQ